MKAGKVTLSKYVIEEEIIIEDFTRKKHSHPRVHCPVTTKSKKKIKAFSVNSKERRQKCSRIMRDLEFHHRKPITFANSKDKMLDYSHIISLMNPLSKNFKI